MTMFRFYTDNLLSGEYGTLRSAIKDPIHDLADISVAGSLFIRNISILSKLELGSWKDGEHILSFHEALERAITNMHPLILPNEVEIAEGIRTLPVMLDEKYGLVLFENILFAFADLYQFYECDGPFMLHVSLRDGAVFVCEARFACKQPMMVPDDPLNKKQLFADAQSVWSRVSLPLYVAGQIMERAGGRLRIEKSDDLEKLFCVAVDYSV